ncbi:probable rRNA maturation factor [Cohaesibacter sp. ES.047]|uniref:rRNA maturation RNase YbeY n=1 Tax=Cohaesibacter sp. ES.047 TaxID=1798205 RepID=UPI000BB89124|nr:rRNA maturation RNase YbeY [Cohaesibacter sp. ES.047]SNY90388.1 probable rRNA maturation factor [Cohaesibacter sp. ES.047]
MTKPQTPDGELSKDFLIEAKVWNDVENLELFVAFALDAAYNHVIRQEGIAFLPECEISLVFVDDAAIRKLNAEHRGKDKPTNVLSFPQDENADVFGPMLGDVVFAHETILREADEMGLAIPAHLTHLCIHGFLHLLGYDHIEPDEADKMESVEVAILAELGLENPYEGTIVTDMLE